MSATAPTAQVLHFKIIIIIIIIELYLNTVLFHKLLTFNLIMYKREGKEKM